MKYKLIALDLDGTLNTDEKTVTPKTRDALLAAQRQGITVALCSARPVPGLYKEMRILEMEKYHGMLIAYNGGKILRADDKTVLHQQSFPVISPRKSCGTWNTIRWYLSSMTANAFMLRTRMATKSSMSAGTIRWNVQKSLHWLISSTLIWSRS